jgi:trehalose 6-phosphate phosphatase
MPEPGRTSRAAPAPEVRAALAPLLVRPATSAVLTDFDGTISPIVTDPHQARPLEGTGAVLAALARRFAEVAVVSGRSVPFLSEHLGVEPPTGPDHRVRLVGLYGLERSWGDGPVTRDPAAEAWQPAIDDAVATLRRAAPSGVLVEPKGLAVTVHWRRAPEAEGWVTGAVAAQVAQSGLRAHPGRLSVELRPPLDIDKGSVVRDLAGSCSAVCYFGDDLGDLPAFAALAALRSEGIHTVSVAVLDPESDPAVAEAADVAVTGQGEALDVLAWLAEAATGGPGSTD